MAWQCTKCSRFWGRCRRTCPLCLAISERQVCLLKLAASARLPNEVRIMIGESLGVFRPVLPLPKLSLCSYGSPLNCRCAHCRHVAPYIVRRYSKKISPRPSRGCTLGSYVGTRSWSCPQRFVERTHRFVSPGRSQPCHFECST